MELMSLLGGLCIVGYLFKNTMFLGNLFHIAILCQPKPTDVSFYSLLLAVRRTVILDTSKRPGLLVLLESWNVLLALVIYFKCPENGPHNVGV